MKSANSTKFACILCLLYLFSSEICIAENSPIIIINRDKKKDVFLHYSNVFTEQIQRNLKANETLIIRIDSIITNPLLIYFPCSTSHLGLSIAAIPGDTIWIDYDSKNDTYNFKGKHQAELDFFKSIGNSKTNLTPSTYWVTNNYNGTTYDEYFKFCSNSFARIDSLALNLRAKPTVRNLIKDYVTQEFRFIKLGLLTCPFYRINLTDYDPPMYYQDSVRKYGAVLEEINPSMISTSQRCLYGLKEYNQFLLSLEHKKKTTETLYSSATQNFKGIQRELLCFLLIKDAQRGNENVSSQFSQFKKISSPQSIFLKNLMIYEALDNFPILDDQALNDSLFDLKGNNVRFFDILSQQKGNVVYIDIWASWCGPCLLEMPNSVSLSDKFHDQAFKVVYLSIDLDFRKWQEASAGFLGSSQYSYDMPNITGSGLVKKFGIQLIPRYLIIDKNGVLRYHKAPSPSDPALKEIINSLLKE